MAESFSKRMGYKKLPDKLVHGEAPKAVREEFIWVIEKICSEAAPKLSHRLYLPITQDEFERNFMALLAAIATRVDRSYRRRLNWSDLCDLKSTCPWHEFYDLCEYVFGAFIDLANTRTELEFLPIDYENEMNRLFQDHGMGYRMNMGQVEHFGSEFTREVVQKARELLQAPEFAGPDEQFGKAVAFLSQRPAPDRENCVKEATGALEGTARLVSGDKTATLGDILSKHFKRRIPGALFKAFEGVWGYASVAPGARHAKVGGKQVTEAEAELVLGICAAMILYIAKFTRET